MWNATYDVQILLTIEAQPFNKEEINERLRDPYDERRLLWYTRFAYEGGETIPKKKKDHRLILTIAGPQPTYNNNKKISCEHINAMYVLI